MSTYTFSTDELDEARLCLDASAMACVLWAVQMRIRALLKHGDLDECCDEQIEKLQAFLLEEMDDRGIVLDR